MSELNSKDVDFVSGGVRLAWKEGAGIIFGLSMYSPVTMAIGFPIAGAMLIISHYER